MKRRRIWTIIGSVVIIAAGVLGILFLRHVEPKINFTFAFDDFTFMNHTLSEGDQMNAIMRENNIVMTDNRLDQKDMDFWVNYDEKSKTQMLMCPVETKKESEKCSISVYNVSKDYVNDGRVSFGIIEDLLDYEAYYKGPIHTGDSLEQVYRELQIEEIMKSGVLVEKNNRRYYTCDSNFGEITLLIKADSGIEDLDKYSTTEEYLKAGNGIGYGIKFDEYYLSVHVDESQTVSGFGLTYDPNHVIENSSLSDLIF